MVSYDPIEQKAVEIGEHIDGIGTVLDPDDESVVKLMEGRETFTLSEIEQLFDDLYNADGGTLVAIVDGVEYRTDWGYGIDAVEHFINMLKRRHGLLH